MKVLDIKKNESILIIAPHPDDECIGAGGVLLQYKEQCTVVVLTDGAVGQGNRAKSVEIDLRKKEFISEMEYLGISSYFLLGIPDGTLLGHSNCLSHSDVAKYDYIFVTGPLDGHPDHSGAYYAVRNELLNLERKERPRVFLYEVHRQLLGPTHFIDITGRVEEKGHLIRFHKSQVEVMPYDKMAILNAGYRGIQNRMPGKQIEVFQEIDDIDDAEGLVERENETKLQKHIQFYQLLVHWMRARINGKSCSAVLKEHGIRCVTIYGYAELGELLLRDLLGSDVVVIDVLDKSPSKETLLGDCVTIRPEKGNRMTDAVIVTAVYYYSSIKEELEDMGYTNVYSLSDIVEWM